MNLASLLPWLSSNWIVVLAVVVGIVANLAPRPHPDQLTGWQKVFWTIIDRLCFLTASKVPGDWKWIFTASPAPELPGRLPPMAPPPPPPTKD